MGCPAWLVVPQEEERSLHGGVGTQHHLDAGTQGCCAQEWTQAWGRAVTLGGMGTGRLSYNSDTVWPLEGKAVGLRDSLSPSSMGPAAPRRLLCGSRGGPWVPTLGPGHTALRAWFPSAGRGQACGRGVCVSRLLPWAVSPGGFTSRKQALCGHRLFPSLVQAGNTGCRPPKCVHANSFSSALTHRGEWLFTVCALWGDTL